MEADDFFRHHVNVRRPVLFKQLFVVAHVPERSQIIGKRVYPYVDAVLVIEGHGYAPTYAGAADRQILQTGFDKVVDHLVDAGFGLQKFRIFFVKFQ